MIEIKFREAIQAAGIEFRGDVIADGKIHRCHVEGDNSRSRNGWYVLNDDDIPTGAFGCFKRDIFETWTSKDVQTMADDEKARCLQKIEEARQQRAKEEEQVRADCRQWSTDTFNKAKGATNEHPYLKRKGVKAYGLRQLRENLLIPLLDGSAEIHGLQFIMPDGSKKFKTGTQKKGKYFAIGTPKDNTLLLCEGYATGASLHESTGYPVAVCFDAGNLEAVAEVLRRKYPKYRLIICADNDQSGIGQKKAAAAAKTVGGEVVMPPDIGDDFNDLHQKKGPTAVKAIFEAALIEKSANHPLCEKSRSVDFIRGSDIEPEPVSWLWKNWLAEGKMHILGGAPGTGKTTIAMSLAATVTIGGRWPDCTRAPIGNVVIWSGEDDPKDTLVPRLSLSGADLSKIYFISDVKDGNERRSFDPAKDMEMLRSKLKEVGNVRLLIVDPIVSAVAGDSHKNAEVRRSLQPLADLATAMHCALLGITHFSKGTGGRDPVERITGSLAFGALARIVLVAAKQQEEDEAGRTVRLFLRAKSNIGPDDGGFEYDLQQDEMKSHPGIFSSYVLWGAAVEGAARELLATADATGGDGEGGSLAGAKRFLLDLLSNGPASVKSIKVDADGAGFSWATMRRAQKALKIKSRKIGGTFGNEIQKWVWELPVSEDVQLEHLSENKLKMLKNMEGAQEIPSRFDERLEHLQKNSEIVVEV